MLLKLILGLSEVKHSVSVKFKKISTPHAAFNILYCNHMFIKCLVGSVLLKVIQLITVKSATKALKDSAGPLIVVLSGPLWQATSISGGHRGLTSS